MRDEHPEKPRRSPEEMLADYLRPYGTSLLLFVNLAMFAWIEAHGGAAQVDLVAFGARYAPATWGGEFWRLVTCLFLHADWIHLLLNCAVLLLIGRSLELSLGTKKFLALYFTSGIFGGLVSDAIYTSGGVAITAFTGDIGYLSIGSSGAVFGILGSGLLLNILAAGGFRKAVQLSSTQILMLLILTGLLLGLTRPLIDNGAHLGGLFAGMCLTPFLARASLPRFMRRTVYIAVIVASVTVLGSVGWGLKGNFESDNLARQSILLIERNSPEAAFDLAERALRMDPSHPLALHVATLCSNRTNGKQEISDPLAGEVEAALGQVGELLVEGTRHFDSGKYELAIPVFTRLLEQNDLPLARALRGIALLYREDGVAQARADLAAIAGDPEHPYHDWANYGLVRAGILQDDRALMDEAAARLRPGTARHWDAWIEVYHFEKDAGYIQSASRAFTELESFGKRIPSIPTRSNYLAYLYAECGVRLDKALDLALEADRAFSEMTHGHGEPEVHDTLGWVYLKLHDTEAALFYLRTAALNTRNGVIHYHLAEALRKHTEPDYGSAEKAFVEALHSGDLSFREYKEAMRGLADVRNASLSL